MPPKKKQTGDVKTPTSFDDVKNYKLDELKEVAKKLGLKNLPKTKASILDVIRVHFGGEAPSPKQKDGSLTPKTFDEVKNMTVANLKIVADKLKVSYKKTVKKAELLELLKKHFQPSSPEPQPVVAGDKPKTPPPSHDIEKLKTFTVVKLKSLADELGIEYKKTIKKTDLLELIRVRLQEGGGQKQKTPVETADEEPDVQAWPVPEEILRKKYNTVAKLKELLTKMGITKAIPKNKNDILAFFRKKRCSPSNYSCSETELCDLRNQLCEELGLVRTESGELKKLEGGMDVVFADGVFYGPKHIIEKIKADWEKSKAGIMVERQEEEEVAPSKTPSPVVPLGGFQERKQSHVPVPVQQAVPVAQEPKEKGISPININQLIDKPYSESEIRQTILHCLGLYQEINPNDEILP